MKVFQFNFFYCYNKGVLLKPIIFLIILLCCLFNLTAQREHNIKLKIEAGLLEDFGKDKVYASGGLLRVEPKLKTSKNTVIGLRIGTSANSQEIEFDDPSQFTIDYTYDRTNQTFGHNGNRIFSLVPTFDYYFIKKKLRPYLGVGVGYYFLTNSRGFLDKGNTFEVLEVSVNNKVGVLVRGGLDFHKSKIGRLDLSKFSVGLELNYIPKTDVKIPNGQVVGTVANSFIGFSFGYTIGLGKRIK